MSQGQRRRILFVCGGNTCRSPMAAAIAKQIFGDQAQTESAGTDPGRSVTSEAVEVIAKEFGIDISSHHPRDVGDLSLHEYDIIIAMDPYVQRQLVQRHNVAPDRLVSWDIDDPWRKGVKAYHRCFRGIHGHLQGLASRLKRDISKTRDGSIEYPGRDEHLIERAAATNQLHQLREDVARWKAELDAGEIRGTTLYGIASKAADRFEKLFRDVLGLWLNDCGINYDDQLKANMGKPFNKLTLGQVYECFKFLAKELAQCDRSRTASISTGGRLLAKKDEKVLDQLCKLRNLRHHASQFAKDEVVLVENTRQLLCLIARALDSSCVCKAVQYGYEPCP